MFDAEAEGLHAIAQTGAVRVPTPLCTGEDAGPLLAGAGVSGSRARRRRNDGGAGATACAACIARARNASAGIATTPSAPRRSRTAWTASWIEFWRTQRLGFQLELAARNGYGGSLQRRGEQLLAQLDALLAHDPAPSLLHGDLWGGNAAATPAGEPVLFDPACYFGDREADLAMTELFGGFAPAFYSAYRDTWPVDAGYGVRRDLYNLYHVLNHLNLFGGGYRAQAEGMIERLLSEVR